jgi:hypothetical protein
MRTIEKSDIEIMVPFARQTLALAGREAAPRRVLSCADDESISGLAAAHVNWEQIRRAGVGDVYPCWCECNPEPEAVYYCNKDNGSHGWMCSVCLGIQQVG